MTVNIAACRGEFGVIGADQLTTALGPKGPEPVELNTKLWVHPSLPLAAATAGIAAIVPGPVRSITAIADVLGTRRTNKELEPRALDAHIVHELRERVAQTLVVRREIGHDAPPELEVLKVIVVHMYLGHAHLRQIVFGDADPVVRSGDELISAPDHLRPIYTELFPENGPRLAERCTARDIAGCIRFLIERGIEEERRRFGGNVWVGGEADVAIVNSSGAKVVLVSAKACFGGSKSRLRTVR